MTPVPPQHQDDTDRPLTRNLRKAIGSDLSTVPRHHSTPVYEIPAFKENSPIYLETNRARCIYIYDYIAIPNSIEALKSYSISE